MLVALGAGAVPVPFLDMATFLGTNVNLVAFNRYGGSGLDGQVFALFVIVLAAAEAAVGLAIVLTIFQTFRSIDVRLADTMRE